VVWIAGLVASVGVAILGVFCILSVLQLAMLNSRDQVVMKYSIVVITKVGLGLLSALLAIAAAGLFALQTDDREHNGFEITRGPAFYIQVGWQILTQYSDLPLRGEQYSLKSLLTTPDKSVCFYSKEN
uniref:Uncharacterized protein LOC114346566 n=1 Tax=Diabrotica virgifera virgifera TaxID=50390 RepID=A0A6P7GUB6_DIAVI